jgi:probable HAF family extracellular repeat protein
LCRAKQRLLWLAYFGGGQGASLPGGVSRLDFLEILMQARNCFPLFVLSLSVGLTNAAWAHAEYRVTVMGPANSVATDINSTGVVVGYYHPRSPTVTHAFLNRGTGLVDLGKLTGVSSEAVAINDKGHVLGQWKTSADQQRGFIYAGGKIRDIGIIPGRNTIYTDINNAGFITAYGGLIDSFWGPQGFLRAPDGTFRDIGSLPFENPITLASALNNRNQIAGASGPLVFPDQPWRAIIWTNGVMRDLGDLGFTPNYGVAINECGQVTGSASLPVGFRDRKAFLYTNGRMIDIDGRPDNGERSSAGTGINNHGHVVGASNHLSGFIYRGKRMQSLNALIAPKSGWDIGSPEAVNDAGQIAATAYRNNVSYAVRLDLIRPHVLRAPDLEKDDGAGPVAKGAATSEADAKADAEAQEREIAQPVKQ